MVVAERTRLADVVDRWIARQRVTIAHIVQAGGISRNTIWLIQQGTTTSPEPETLRKIARGLATDPTHLDDFDRAIYVEALRDLSLAAGLPDLTVDIPPCDLEAEIRAVVKDRSRASAFAAFIRKYPRMTPGELQIVNALLDNLGDSK